VLLGKVELGKFRTWQPNKSIIPENQFSLLGNSSNICNPRTIKIPQDRKKQGIWKPLFGTSQKCLPRQHCKNNRTIKCKRKRIAGTDKKGK